MYIRFVIERRDPDSGRRQGLFQAAYGVLDSGALSRGDWDRLAAVINWFDANLNTPSRLAVSRRPHAKAQAIGWLKSTATDHLAKMRELQRIVEEQGIPVEMLTTERPGYLVYEDEFQIAAYPFRDTQT